MRLNGERVLVALPELSPLRLLGTIISYHPNAHKPVTYTVLIDRNNRAYAGILDSDLVSAT